MIANRTAQSPGEATANIMPVDTMFYLSLNTHADQLPNFNVIADAWKDSKEARMLASALQLGVTQAGLNWEEDIQPWLGQRVALGIGYVPQSRGLFAGMTVAENLALGRLARATDGAKGVVWSEQKIFEYFPRLKERMPIKNLGSIRQVPGQAVEGRGDLRPGGKSRGLTGTCKRQINRI